MIYCYIDILLYIYQRKLGSNLPQLFPIGHRPWRRPWGHRPGWPHPWPRLHRGSPTWTAPVGNGVFHREKLWLWWWNHGFFIEKSEKNRINMSWFMYIRKTESTECFFFVMIIVFDDGFISRKLINNDQQNQHFMICVNEKNTINRMFFFCDDYSFWSWFYIKKTDQ